MRSGKARANSCGILALGFSGLLFSGSVFSDLVFSDLDPTFLSQACAWRCIDENILDWALACCKRLAKSSLLRSAFGVSVNSAANKQASFKVCLSFAFNSMWANRGDIPSWLACSPCGLICPFSSRSSRLVNKVCACSTKRGGGGVSQSSSSMLAPHWATLSTRSLSSMRLISAGLCASRLLCPCSFHNR